MEELHFSQIISAQAKKYGDKIALYSRKHNADPWEGISWKEFEKKVIILSKALLELGLPEQKCVGQFSQNMAENLIVDFALFSIRDIMVPIYPTSTVSQVEFITNNAEIEILFVGEQTQYDIAVEVFSKSKHLKKIIVFDNDVTLTDEVPSMYFDELLQSGQKSTLHFELENRLHEANEDDLACILYTSGTTGNPKGVMMPHSNFLEAMRIHKIRLTSITDKDVSIAFLPLSHVFERTWCYLCIYNGVTIYVNLRPLEIQQNIKEIRPTLMCAVPRFWEKVYVGVQENIAKMSPSKLAMVAWAQAVGKQYNLDYLRNNRNPGIFLRLKYTIADHLVFSKVKKTLGIEKANMLPTAGAKLSDEIAIFMISIGIPVFYGYGLTESTATVTAFEYIGYEIGSVGTIMPDVQVRIGDQNEIELKGKTIFKGYYKNKKATSEAFTEDGWFKTGDAGILKNNTLYLTERIKDLFKTSNGKYIAPQEIETRLSIDKYIEQVAVIGDEKNFVTAIISPSINAITEYAQKKKIPFENISELIQHPEINKLIESRIRKHQTGMAGYEQIKKFALIDQSFSIETGELTNTLKIRRTVILQKYKCLIDKMYESLE